MPSEKICVIVPVFNRQDCVKRCINSIINQTYTNLNIVLIDDASTDKTLDTLNYYAKKDSRIKVISSKKNNGVGVARNKGLNYFFNSDCEYVTFVDSDDYIHADFIKVLYSLSVELNCDIVSCGKYLNSSENFDTKHIDKVDYKIFDNETAFVNDHAVLWAKLFKKKCFINNKSCLSETTNKYCFCDELRLSEDFSILYKLYINANICANTSEKLYYNCYDTEHLTGGGIKSFNQKLEIFNILSSFNHAIDFLLKSNFKKITEVYIKLYAFEINIALEKELIEQNKDNFYDIFSRIYKYNLKNTIQKEFIVLEKAYIQQLKNDSEKVVKLESGKLRSILYFYKHYFDIKIHSRKRLFNKYYRKFISSKKQINAS